MPLGMPSFSSSGNPGGRERFAERKQPLAGYMRLKMAQPPQQTGLRTVGPCPL